MFFKVDMFFFQKNLAKKYMFLWSIKQNNNFSSNIMNASLRRNKKCQKVIFADDTYLGPLSVQVQPVRAWF